jgi:hypothetical protein
MKGMPMADLKEEQLLTIVTQIVERHGCRIVEIDLERHILNIEGPEENQLNCAQALEEVLG